ncbi:OmpA family protein [Albibacillus kandeliae]|uniref:OmpA family protein n=1 Tax=Albibacillus kandeliae TaxID=2174228 RepID=UPI000D695340|nr:OmpA family protein [Albibacillus kandeliae]
MKRFLKSSTALAVTLSLAIPHVAIAQSQADVDKLRQQLEAQQDQQAEGNAAAGEELQAQAAEDQPEKKTKEERKAERKAERKEQRQQEKAAQAEAEAAAGAKATEESAEAPEPKPEAEQPTQADAGAAEKAPEAQSALGAPAQDKTAEEKSAETTASEPVKAEAEAEVKTESAEPKPAATAAVEDGADQTKTKEERQAERKAARQAERAEDVESAPKLDSQQQADRAARREERQAAAAAAAAGAEAKGEVKTETITEQDVRRADEEFAKPANTVKDDDSGLSNVGKVALLGLGALAVTQLLKNNDKVVSNSGDRIVVQGDDGLRVLKDDDVLLRQPGSQVQTERFNDGSTRSFVTYEDGSRVETIRAADGRVLRRTRIMPNGQQVVLFDDTRSFQPVQVSELPTYRTNQVNYGQGVSQDDLRLALAATQANEIGRTFSLSQVRNIDAVRRLVPEINVNNVTFATGSSAINPEQAQQLAALGSSMREAIRENPGDVFLIEGHTDAVGTAGSNLALSDRRAETVALALTQYFQVPPENLVVQGYGESDLKVATSSSERANRRVAVRNITPLLN